MDLSNVYTYIERFVQTWQVSLLMGVILFSMARYVRDLAIVLMGYFVGAYIVLPYLVVRFPAVGDLLKNIKSPMIAEIAVGLVSAVVIYALFKIFIFLAAFIVVGLLSYYAVMYLGSLFNIQDYVQGVDLTLIYLAVGGVMGIIGGVVANRRERDIMAFMSMVLGAFILSAVLAHFLLGYLDIDLNTTTGLYIILGLFVVLFVLGMRLNFRRASKSKQS